MTKTRGKAMADLWIHRSLTTHRKHRVPTCWCSGMAVSEASMQVLHGERFTVFLLQQQHDAMSSCDSYTLKSAAVTSNLELSHHASDWPSCHSFLPYKRYPSGCHGCICEYVPIVLAPLWGIARFWIQNKGNNTLKFSLDSNYAGKKKSYNILCWTHISHQSRHNICTEGCRKTSGHKIAHNSASISCTVITDWNSTT